MSVIMTKGEDFVAQYSVTDMASASDWVGTVGMYSDYPNSSALLTKTLVYDPLVPALVLTIPLGDLQDIPAGMYALVANISSVTLSVSVNKLDYATLLAAGSILSEPMTMLTMTLIKSDGTPAGKETRTLKPNGDGTMSAAIAWEGVSVTISNSAADAISGKVVDTETITVKTDPAGYAQAAVIKGMIVNVSCPYFGKSITVDTTGHDTIDLSSYF